VNATIQSLPIAGTSVKVRSTDENGRRTEHPAVVSESFSQSVVVRFDAEADIPAGAVELVYAEGDGAELSISDVVARWIPGSGMREMIFHTIKRDSLRLAVSPRAFVVDVGDHTDCPLTDMSFGGIAVKAPQRFSVNSHVRVRLRTDDTHHSGEFRVCHVQDLPCGRFKCGLELVDDETEFTSWLRYQVMRIQRSRLKRSMDIARGSVDAAAAPSEPEEPAYIELRVERGLLVDRVLPFAIQDEDGKTLCEAATKPDESVLKNLHERLFTIVELIDIEMAIAENSGCVNAAGREKRQHERTEYRTRAAVQMLSKDDRRLLEVDTLNISRGGLSFQTSTMIYEGASLMLMLDPTTRAPWILARVAHCEKVDGGYRVGVSFTQSSVQRWEAPHPDDLVSLLRAVGGALNMRVSRRDGVFEGAIAMIRQAVSDAHGAMDRWLNRRRAEFSAMVTIVDRSLAPPSRALAPAL